MKNFNTLVMLLLVILILLCGCNKKNPLNGIGSSDLQFDGIYQSEKYDNQYWHYIRFYEDGTVLTVSTAGTPLKIVVWFKKENIKTGNFSHGKFDVDDNHVVFSATSASGTVDHEGDVQADTLTLKSYSHINENRETRIYTFVSLSE